MNNTNTEKNRIKKLFSEFEIREIGIKKVTDKIRKEMGTKFNCNRVEADWITTELKKTKQRYFRSNRILR